MKISEKQYVNLEIEFVTLSNDDVVLASPIQTGKDEWDFTDFGEPQF